MRTKPRLVAIEESDTNKPFVYFDHHCPAHAVHSDELLKLLRETTPVAWSPNHGGFWVVTGNKEVAEVLHDHETYSSAVTMNEDGTHHGGEMVPEQPSFFPLIPAETDPPDWNEYRRILVNLLSPTYIDSLRPRIEEITTRGIDRIVETGNCDLVYDIANPLPAAVMVASLGLDFDEWEPYVIHLHNVVAGVPGTEDHNAAAAAMIDVYELCGKVVRDRRENPGADIVSRLMAATVFGEPITEQLAGQMLFSMMLAGTDTSTMFLGNSFAYLGKNPEQRAWLLEDRGRLPLAIEELLRWRAPGPALGRTVTKETSLGGYRLNPGDRVLTSVASANRDESVFSDPDKCVLDRYPNRHASFGIGIHRCIGAHLARAEVNEILWQTLTRLKDYEIDYANSERYPDIGMANGWVKLPATFTPGARLAS